MPPARCGSKLDVFVEWIDSWVATYDDLTAVRLHERLQAEDFTGCYTIVREYLKRLRARRTPQQAVQVAETPAGLQAEVDGVTPRVCPAFQTEFTITLTPDIRKYLQNTKRNLRSCRDLSGLALRNSLRLATLALFLALRECFMEP